MSENQKLFTCKKCGETKPLEGFYTNSKIDKNNPYQLVCRKCYWNIRRARENRNPKENTKTNSVHKELIYPTVNYIPNKPATLTCTIEQFHQFIGTKIIKDIQIMTKREKQRLKNKCENCGEERELESAHSGKDRIQIINEVIKKYVINEQDQVIQVDLEKVTVEIMEAHKPLRQHFMFICNECHREFHRDNKEH
jgi:hypothetical protein